MRTEPTDTSAVRNLAANITATIEQASAARQVVREAVVAALTHAFTPADLHELMLDLAEHQRPVREHARRERLAAAVAGRAEGRLEEAREAAEAAVRLDFANPESHWVLGAILEQAGDVAAAHTEYLLAMHLGWDGADTGEAIARTDGAPSPSEDGVSPAERRFRDAVERAITCIESRSLGQARRYARAAVTLDPSRPEGFNLLGVLAELGGRRSEARVQYRVANELAPGFRPAAENLTRLVRSWTEHSRPVW